MNKEMSGEAYVSPTMETKNKADKNTGFGRDVGHAYSVPVCLHAPDAAGGGALAYAPSAGSEPRTF